MIRRFYGWWFEPGPAARLGMLRFGLGVYQLQDIVRTRAGVLALADQPARFFEPIGVTSLLSGPISPSAWALVIDACIVLNVLWMFGVAWRVTAPAYCLLFLFESTYRLSWGMVYHVTHLPMLHVIAVSLGPAAAAASVDAWLRRRWPGAGWVGWLTSAPGGAGSSWHYGWPVRLVCMVTMLAYFLAGYAKINADAGFGWASGQNLLDQAAYDGLYKELLDREPASPLIGMFYRHPGWMAVPATMTLILELGAPLFLVHRQLARLWAVGVVGMHWGIHLMMNLVFPYPISGAAFLSFFPLERLVGRGEDTARPG